MNNVSFPKITTTVQAEPWAEGHVARITPSGTGASFWESVAPKRLNAVKGNVFEEDVESDALYEGEIR